LEVDHGGFDVGVAEEALDGLEVEVGQKEMTCVRVPKSMWGNTLGDAGPGDGGFDGSLDMGFMKVIAAHFAWLAEECELGSGKEPLPNVFAGGVFVFFLELAWQENAGIAFGQVLGMEAADFVHLLTNFR